MVIPPVTGASPIASTPSAVTATSPDKVGGNAFAGALDQVQQQLRTADVLGQQLATGQLTDVHTYMAAATQAQLGVQLTVAVRDRAVEAYQEIMRMQI